MCHGIQWNCQKFWIQLYLFHLTIFQFFGKSESFGSWLEWDALPPLGNDDTLKGSGEEKMLIRSHKQKDISTYLAVLPLIFMWIKLNLPSLSSDSNNLIWDGSPWRLLRELLPWQPSLLQSVLVHLSGDSVNPGFQLLTSQGYVKCSVLIPGLFVHQLWEVEHVHNL